MSRAASGDVVAIKPGLNIYTTLVFAAFVVQVIGLAIIWIRAKNLGVAFF